MLLTIDIGNTNVTLGLYKGDVLGSHWRLATDHARMPDEYGLQFEGLLQNAGHTIKDLKAICLASVVPQLTGRVVQACREYLEKDPFVVEVGIKTGIKLATEALFVHAAKLPRIDLQRPPSVIGRNTVHAMQAGLLFGYVSMVEGMVERFRKELGLSMKVIATGGLAPIIAQETDVIQIIAPWLTLEGLRILWDLNHPL